MKLKYIMEIEIVTDGIPTGLGGEIAKGPEILRLLVCDKLDLLKSENCEILDIIFNEYNGELYAMIKYKKL
jgi:hypothetical protein